MRNKVNRLEEIFMQLVEGRAAADAPRNGSSLATPATRAHARARVGTP
jgi:hypothetical protein